MWYKWKYGRVYYHPKCRRYSEPKDWLKDAENAMRGYNKRQNVLWRKNEELARTLIWC